MLIAAMASVLLRNTLWAIGAFALSMALLALLYLTIAPLQLLGVRCCWLPPSCPPPEGEGNGQGGDERRAEPHPRGLSPSFCHRRFCGGGTAQRDRDSDRNAIHVLRRRHRVRGIRPLRPG